MASDRLIELALAFRRAKLWNLLFDTELFAFSAPDGTLCYCCVMGQLGQHMALAVYPGREGLSTYHSILTSDEDLSPAQRWELMCAQRCIQCSFESKDVLPDGQLGQVRDYARRSGLSLRGKNAFPFFQSYRPQCLPWPELTEAEEALLCQGLETALAVKEAVGRSGKDALGFQMCHEGWGTIPLAAPDPQGGLRFTSTPLPEPLAPDDPAPLLLDELKQRRLLRLARKGYWCCELVLAPDAVEQKEGGPPRYPLLLLCWDSVSEQFATPELMEDTSPEAMLDALLEQMLRSSRRPRSIRVRDRRTFRLLEDAAGKLGITLTEGGDLSPLDEIEENLYHLGADETPDELQMVYDVLMEMSPEEFGMLPAEMLGYLEDLRSAGMLPEALEKRLALLRTPKERPHEPIPFPKKGRKRREKTDRSYIISASLGTGCYRHLRLSGDSTLADLADAILDAFSFDNDHMHLFTMDNRSWDSADVYNSHPDSFTGAPVRLTRRYRLDQMDWSEGKRFKFLFDFGDEWWFQCRVLRILQEPTREPIVVRSMGDPPAQYGAPEDDE